MLNTKDNFTINLAARNGASRRIVVRWPSDEEWIKREASRVAPLKIAKGETEVVAVDMDAVDEADLAMFKAIHVAGDHLEDDALMIVDLLSCGRLLPISEEEPWTVIRLAALGSRGVPELLTVHNMQEPTYRLERRWKAQSSSTKVKGTTYRVSEDLRFAAEMYGALAQNAEGYDGPIPIIHKAAIVKELFSRLAAREESDSQGSKDLDPAAF